MPKQSPSAQLRELERLKLDFSSPATARRIELVESLGRSSLRNATEVGRLHELLVHARAYATSRELLDAVERALAAFASRRDLRRHRDELLDSGIAGTDLYFRFYWLMATRLLAPHGPELSIDWEEFEHAPELVNLLHLLLPFAETPALDGLGLDARTWLEELKGPEETDAAFLIRRFQTLELAVPVREKIFEDLDIPMRLAPSETTPARTREHWPRAKVVYQTEPPEPGRVDLVRAIREEAPEIRPVSRHVARELIDLANECMVPRHRDLLIFLYADDRDVRLVDFGDGLQFACMGAVPERRLVLESVYGFLTLMNGVPLGYVLGSAFFGSSEVAFNVFETFRGTGAAEVYSRVLAMVHRLFGTTSFAIDPYQLGHNNSEGLSTGAWWFYYKLGYRPRDPRVKRLVRKELATIKKNPRHRTSEARLNELSSEYMFLDLEEPRDDTLGQIELGNIGLAISRYLANRFGAERELGVETCMHEAAELLELGSLRELSKGERIAWERWAPLVLALPGVRRWPAKDRRALRDVMRAKGGQRESDYVWLCDRHARLREALLELAATHTPSA